MSVDNALHQNTIVHSYLFLRRAIGLIGTALPFALVIGVLVQSGVVLSVSWFVKGQTLLRDFSPPTDRSGTLTPV